MPTRNRVGLLERSLRSALELRGDDYEVVVSDNCSTDGTREYVEALRDPRVRYVRTPSLVPVSEHMAFVLARANGEFVKFLADDDAIVASALESARDALATTRAELVAWPIGSYFYPDWHDRRYRNTLVVGPYSGRTELVRSDHTLAAAYREIEFGRLAFLMNSVCRRTLIERASRRVPRLFPALLLSEVFAGVVVLLEAGTYAWVDIPLTIFGRWPRSVGSSLTARRWSAGPAYVQDFPREATFENVPLAISTPTNLLADALARAKSALGAELGGIDLDWAQYFVRNFRDLMTQRDQGVDVTEDLRALRAAVARQADPVRRASTTAIEALERTHRRSWKSAARRLVNRVPPLGWLASVARPALAGESGAVLMQGSRAGFGNILECVRAWDGALSGRRASRGGPGHEPPLESLAEKA
jgi:glycosyltransferase involved in cell wall biosynthesis